MRIFKYLFPAILLTILLNTVSGQGLPSGLPITTSRGWIRYGYVQTDSGFIAALRDTNFVARFPGTLVYWQHAGVDTALWVYSGAKWNKTGGSGSGFGTVTSVSGLSPLFSVANPTTTPTFSLLNVSPYKIFGRASGTGVPSYLSLDTNFITGFSTYIRPLFSAGTGLSYNPVTGVFTNTVSGGWGLTGNSGTTAGTNFVGTTDNVDLVFKTNAALSGRIGVSGTTSFGYETGLNTTSNSITAVGYQALKIDASLGNNTGVGYQALTANTTAYAGTAVGAYSLWANTTGTGNTAIGARSLFLNTTGTTNTAAGGSALENNSTGSYNAAVGGNALHNTTTGSRNVAIGNVAGTTNETGNRNTIVGSDADIATVSTSDGVALGYKAVAVSKQLALSDSINQIKAMGIPSGTGYVLTDLGGTGIFTAAPAGTAYFQNALTGDTAFTNPSTDHFLFKSDIWGYGLLSANNSDTTKGAKVDTANSITSRLQAQHLIDSLAATISSGGSQTPWLSNINGANYGLDSVGWLRVGVSGGITTENLAFYSAQPQNASYYGSTDITITGNQALDVEGNLTLAELNITNAGSNFVRNTNSPDLLVTAGDTYVFSMDIKQESLSSGYYSVYDVTHSANIIAPTLFSIPAGLATRFTSASFVIPAGCTEIYIYPARDVPSTGTYFVGRLQVAHVGNAYIQTTTAQAPPSSSGGYLTAIETDSVTANIGLHGVPDATFNTTEYGSAQFLSDSFYLPNLPSGVGAYALRVGSDGKTYKADTAVALNLTTYASPSVATLSNNVLNIKKDTVYGTFINMPSPITALVTGLSASSAFYSISGGGINFTGNTRYIDNVFTTDSSSASNNFQETLEFTLTTKPTSSSEGIFLGRSSTNSTDVTDLFTRVNYVSSSTWTLSIYSNYAYVNPTLVATVPFSETVPMTLGKKYRITLSFSAPFVFASLALIDSTQPQFKDIINVVSATYKFPSPFPLANVNMPNTGQYSFGALGSTNVYRVTSFNSQLDYQKYPDVEVIGNSISQQYNATNPNNTYISRLFQQSNITYVNLSGQGDKTADALNRMQEALNFKAKYALVELGPNDYGQGVSNATFETNLTLILNRLIANGTTPIIIKFTNNNSYDTSYYRVAKATGVQLIDMGYQLLGFLDGFNLHPDDYGCEIAANIIRTNMPYLFGTTKATGYPMPNQYLSKTIAANTTWNGATAVYNVDASGGNVQLNFGASGSELIGREVWINKIDATNNIVKAAFFSGSSVNGGLSSTQTQLPYKALHLICTDVNTWVCDTGYYAPAVTTVPLSGITAMTGNATINNAANNLEWQWNTLVTTGLKLSTNSTTASGGQILAWLDASGVNANSNQTTYGLYLSNSHSGTTSATYGIKSQASGGTTNIAGYFITSGGTNNYALIVPSGGGSVGIGTSTPAYKFDVQENLTGVFAANITNNSSTGAGVGINTFSSSTETLFQLLSGALGSTSRLRMNANGHLQIGAGISPSALLQLDPGTAAPTTAPIKFTSGTVMSTPEAGALEYNSGLLMLDSSNSQRDTIATRKWARNNISGGGTSSQWTTLSSDIYYNTGNVGIGSISAPADKLHIRGVSGGGITLEGANPIEVINATSGDPGITFTRGATNTLLYVNSGAQLIIQPYNELKVQQSGTNGFGITSYVGPSFNSAFSIGSTSNPTSTLQSYGSFATGYVAKTGTYTATDYDHTVECTSGTFTVTIPSSVAITGREYVIVNSGAGVITIATTGGEVFKNVALTPTTLTLSAVGAYQLQATGNGWVVLSTN